ncbi:hypothetical protein UCRNP2_3007 [Neofusicoccum parvum UCRNP2]|uniref:Uncharacterized protein n=2 Tax=Neofusicoccum parvum TaxID=310453 RepID=R1GF23_BOTPV|nr:hypothetical protein UCRNP2_3007 [Neofusicoccum parvum UCRNP2]GME22914.1 hypothetical protein AURDEDRAFT_125994 [Neofusicoccum parvum]
MQFTTISLILTAFGAGAAACNCQHNNDAGRWIDSNSPPAAAGAVKDYLAQEASNDQSYDNDWFLWTSITYQDGAAQGTLTIN